MTLKTLLLGTGAAMMVAGAAQAADLTVAEPVDYVKVCDAFGAGFFYSPGTDTCIKIGGYVKFGTNAVGSSLDLPGYSESHSNWGAFYTEASIQLTASTVTEYGNLTGWIDLRTRTGTGYGDTGTIYAPGYILPLLGVPSSVGGDAAGHIDSAYIELGGLKAGHFTSAFDFLGGYTDFGAFRADQSTDHIQYTYAMGSFGLIGSIEDGSDRILRGHGIVSTFPIPPGYLPNDSASPDLVAALTYASGPFNAKLSGAYVQHEVYAADSGWAAQLGVEIALDQFSKGDRFGIQGVYADNAPAYTGMQKFFNGLTPFLSGPIYGGFASYLHYWNPSLWTAAEVSYLHREDDNFLPSGNLWQVSASTDWAIVKNLDLMLDGSYAHLDVSDADLKSSQWSVNLWLKRSW